MSVKIGDFGLAARITGRDSLLYSTCGTANYFAPEIVKKTGYSYEVDVWCAGVMMYFLLVGKAPFDGETIDDLFDKIEDCDYEWVNDDNKLFCLRDHHNVPMCVCARACVYF